MLKFIGTGSAFNTELGNNSAYYKRDKKILIIDCGSSIFERIIRGQLLDGVDEIHVAITHTHSDHVGSLGDLVLYSYFSHGNLAEKIITVYSPADVEIEKLLSINGCIQGVHYDYNNMKKDVGNNIHHIDNDVSIAFRKNTHVNEIPSYSMFLIIGRETNFGMKKDFNIFYSSDLSKLWDKIIEDIHQNEFYNIDYAYIDTSGLDYEGNVHLSYKKLCELIKPEVRHKVWCMHLDKAFDKEQAKKDGFNVAELE